MAALASLSAAKPGLGKTTRPPSNTQCMHGGGPSHPPAPTAGSWSSAGPASGRTRGSCRALQARAWSCTRGVLGVCMCKCACLPVYVLAGVHVQVRMTPCVRVGACACASAHVYLCACWRVCICKCACLPVCVFGGVHVQVRMSTCACVGVCMRVRAHTGGITRGGSCALQA